MVIKGQRRSCKVSECHRRSRKVKEGQGSSWMVFSHHCIDISGEKSYWWVVAFRIILSAPDPVPFLWTLDLILWTLDFGLWEIGLGLGLDN